MKKRVVITGLGPVTPIGIGKEGFWNNLVEGRSNYSEITRFPLNSEDKTRIAAEIKNFNPESYDIDQKLIKSLNNFEVKNAGLPLYYGLAGADLAYKDASLSSNQYDSYRAGVIMGTGVGDLALLQRGNSDFIHEVYTLPNILSGAIAKKYELHGFSTAIGAACASGNVAVRLGYNEISKGDSEVMIVGASEAPIDIPHFFGGERQRKEGIQGFSQKNDLRRGMTPFDSERDGIILSEGAGVLVLEELDHALNRNAKIYAELISFGDYTDFDKNFVRTTMRGYQKSMRKATEDIEDIIERDKTYINAHGTATPLNDPCESSAINAVFQRKCPVSSFKGTLGHSQAAAPAIELIGCALALNKRVIPKSNLEKRAKDCADLDYITESRNMPKLKYIVKNAAGFNGVYSTLILKSFEGKSK